MEIKFEKFVLDQDKAQELKIDQINDNDISNAILESIKEAEKEALLKGIKSNMIILNEDCAYSKGFYYAMMNNVREIPPMILGKMPILYSLPIGYDFALCHSPVIGERQVARIEYLETLEKIVKKYVKTDKKSFKFKNISYKKNKEDFEKLMEVIGYEQDEN